MRVLLIHNYYGSSAPSGENVVFELERDMLVRAGHQVHAFVRHSDEIRSQGWVGTLRGAVSTPWNPWSAAEARRIADELRPEVVHVHNTFPLISPAVFPALRGRAARVLTLHNYRLLCPAAVPLRQGRTCTLCLDRRSAWPSIRHGCYRGSRLATAPLALGVALARARRLWDREVEAFIALTPFQRDLMVGAGLPAGRVHVKPHFSPGRPEVRPWARRAGVAVYVGRLSAEKGVEVLLDAWLAWGAGAPPLRIVGDGPLRAGLEARARSLPPGAVTFLGQVPPAEAEAEIGAARLLVLPSICLEGFPMVLREAFARGTPAAVSDLGALPGLVRPVGAGVAFQPGDPAALLQAVRGAWDSPGTLEALASGARRAYETLYSEGENLRLLQDIYREAMRVRRAGEAG